MSIIEQTKDDDPKDIYFFRNLPKLNTSKLFNVTVEVDKLRVQNKNVNCLFRNLTQESFHQLYNDFYQCLNLDFEPLKLGNSYYELTEEEKQDLFQSIVTNWIYYYTVNNLTVEINRADFIHPYMVDYVLNIMDNKYGEDTEVGLMLGAKILRQGLNDYSNTVKGRRLYYDR